MDDGKIIQCDNRSICEQLSVDNVPILPVVFYDKQSTKKSARN